MRVLTRFTAALLTAGALIAPATMPAAHAATVQSVTHVGALPTPGMFVAQQAPPFELQAGQPLSITNGYLNAGFQRYTITNQAKTASVSRDISQGVTDSLTVPAKDGSTYLLTSSSGASFTFVAL